MTELLKYQSRFDTDAVVRLTDNQIIGPKMEKDWKEYQEWLKQGNKPFPPEPIKQLLEPTIEEKLASVGLNVDDLKTALGLTKKK